GAALGGAALFGKLGGETTTTVVQREVAATPTTQATASISTLSINEIYRRSAPGVVQITSTSGAKTGTSTDPFFGTPFSSPSQQALGSGFVLDKAGHIVTNYHVVQGATKIEVSFSDQSSHSATIVGSDPSTDLAVLKVDVSARALTPLPLGNSDLAQVGDEVVAIGNPFGLDRTATAGIISAIQRRITAPNGFSIDHALQTDAPINHGNSGGPLLDAHGDVVGVNSQIETGGNATEGNVGIGFAVPANTVKNVVAQILASGKVEHAYLGVTVQDLGANLARLFHLPASSGVLVQTVQNGSGAQKAGIKGGTQQTTVAGESYKMGGDLIVSANNKPITSTGALRDLIAGFKPGDKLSLTLYRGTKKITVAVTLGRQPASPPR
ncbi:MAG: trypsin-like peptidase domain-containing protein, partial [Gaiellaceae bacterium]